MFAFADGRRCRTPRISSHPHFCFYHAQKEARARATETKTWPTSSPANTFPPVISAPPWDASSPPSSAAM
jgi:hypothetical protein